MQGRKPGNQKLCAAIRQRNTHTSVSIGTHGDLLHGNTLFHTDADGLAWLDAVRKAVLLPDSGGNVNIASPPRQLFCLLKQMRRTVYMGWYHMAGRNLCLIQNVKQHLDSVLSDSHMELHHTGLGRKHAAQSRLGQDSFQLILGRLGGTVV